MSVNSNKSPPPRGPVELVPSGRGGTKAKYGGRTFTSTTNNGARYHWRCDQRTCRSRLTTDVYGKEHMVFSFVPHDEAEHRRAERSNKRRRSEATHKQQPLERIQDYDYVLEKQDGDTQFWRCEFVKCPGRCRTSSDGVLVAGPSPHLAEVHARRRATSENVGASTSVDHDQPVSLEADRPDVCGITEDSSRESILLQRQEKQEEKHDDKKLQDDEEKEQRVQQRDKIGRRSIVLKLVIKSEEPSGIKWEHSQSSSSAAAITHDVGHDDLGAYAADQRGRANSVSTSTDQATAEFGMEANDTLSGVDRVDAIGFKDNDLDEADDMICDSSIESEFDDTGEDKNAQPSGDNANKNDYDANEKMFDANVDRVLRDQSHATSGDYVSCEDAQERPHENDEQELRANVLVQMRRLLEAETELVHQRRRVEVLRECLLEQQVSNHVPMRLPGTLGHLALRETAPNSPGELSA